MTFKQNDLKQLRSKALQQELDAVYESRNQASTGLSAATQSASQATSNGLALSLMQLQGQAGLSGMLTGTDSDDDSDRAVAERLLGFGGRARSRRAVAPFMKPLFASAVGAPPSGLLAQFLGWPHMQFPIPANQAVLEDACGLILHHVRRMTSMSSFIRAPFFGVL